MEYWEKIDYAFRICCSNQKIIEETRVHVASKYLNYVFLMYGTEAVPELFEINLKYNIVEA